MSDFINDPSGTPFTLEYIREAYITAWEENDEGEEVSPAIRWLVNEVDRLRGVIVKYADKSNWRYRWGVWE